MMEIVFFDQLNEPEDALNLKDFIDVRFRGDSSDALKRRINRIAGEDNISAVVMNDNKTVAAFIGSTNTWSGLKTIFSNGILISKSIDEKEWNKYLNPLIDKCIKNAKELEYKKFLIETDENNTYLKSLLSGLNEIHRRVLLNYSVSKADLLENTKGAIKKIERHDFKITKGDVNNLKPYIGFMDTRPGWLSSNASMNDKAGDVLITVRTSFDTISAIAVFNPETGIISRIATSPLSRLHGFASALLEYIAEHSKTDKLIIVDINRKNIDADEFLKKRGFAPSTVKDEVAFEL